MFHSFHGKYKYRSEKSVPFACALRGQRGVIMDFRYAMLFALLIIPLASAAPSDAGKGRMISAAMADVKCKDAFTVGVMGPMSSTDPSMSPHMSSVQADEAQLQSYADHGDLAGFRNYVRQNYDPQMKSANQAVKDWRTANGRNPPAGNFTPGNLTGRTGPEMNATDRNFTGRNFTGRAGPDMNTTGNSPNAFRGDYPQLKATYDKCNLDALKDYANAKAQAYSEQLDDYAAKTASLNAKGMDVSGMNSLISDARSEVVTALQSDISSATDAQGVAAALKAHCLYDSCPQTGNFHFEAKWESEKLAQMLSVIKANNASANYTTQMSTVESDISTANSGLSAVDSAQYTSAQHDQIWDALNDAAKNLKEILSDMRSGGAKAPSENPIKTAAPKNPVKRAIR